ncbi:MAG: hypothetical protein EBW06_08775, partial [Gammaproteobacteria bacterium]|nr:hypothetical protein [Gammaproteobacteria bacterium]
MQPFLLPLLEQVQILTLTGANTYSGATTINAGTLKATGTLSDSTAVTVASGATYDFDATDTVGSIAGAGTINIASSQTLSAGNDNSDTEFSGVLEGAGAFTKVGSGSLTLTGDNTSTGTYTISAGTLVLNDADGTTGTVIADTANVTVDGGDLSLLDTSGETVATFTVTQGNVTGTFLTASSYVFNPDTGETATIGSVISGSGGLTKAGAGTLVLTGTNTFTGNITISAGTLTIDGTGVLESGNYDGTIANSGTFIYSSTTDQTLAGVISGTGALTKQENSTLTLTGTNTYTGTTTITTGTLDVDGTLAQTAVTVDTNGTYDVDATDTVLSIAGAGTIDLTGAALSAGDGNNQTFSGVFNGANDFTKIGSGTLTLSGDNSTASYTGRIIIDDGVISVAADSNLGSPDTLDADRLILKGGTLQTTASFTLNTNRGITLSTGGGTVNVDSGTTLTYGGVITGSTAFTKSGDGTLDLGGTNTYTGATNINEGELNVTGTLAQTAVTVSSGATYDSDTTDTIGSIAGAGAIEINTGTTLTVGGDNTDTEFSG